MISSAELKVDFRSTLTSERHEIEHRLEAIKDTFERIALGEKSKIEVGSRVIITYDYDGSTQEGRVWNVKSDGTIQVNRDGYKSLINVTASQVQNLSVGTYGLLEKEIWLMENRLEAINDIMGASNIPGIFLKVRDNMVYASNSVNHDYYQVVEFVHAKDLKSYTLTLPINTIARPGYFHIRCSEVDILSVSLSSEFAFKEFYKKS
ncbi:hypothetical protein TH61_16240 [Rufibacter sp. DG15C]|uniref:hypothetical protein n=1 Tax=Rufibacter sp. DG15C TaxID=1379909 RepID=UPI00078DEC9A|nr:hypothetical protein [Rufibacter sp. DG15C]AMM52426.1 hypothetical protein TH61_16240 [Rufibacter sp. DG15C]